ncbi:MAG: N-formylglutamate amidohydrolase [Rhodobacteraceae bacterium]|jgi:predicted N-formylglutamate amidohydrolase|uniref:Putative N-formylglutamate amidohydrolase n=1 Tax=Salipiger profundus TaxID=1229727 RepID=A0A1U7D5P0_9RHOB|nr:MULTISPECIES: N-formylglutamate amidohydrolase [Salipiger]APX23390.1 putative N-formylglutamate amidohydrolase [Salipiger profundus]MAB09117.1 N-formylglutamate amidohydrolase [Paracoccaceae bacterium]GGA24392.1 N-formylglutamate amidohydrolase [Salipiger profundus]SFD44695.1 Predicted N-formylglutamate amidohydrolase [Salipiger profundus]
MTYTPYHIEGEGRKGRFLVTCDHASNSVPPDLGGTLGLPADDMARHIAYDVGALGVARGLAEALDSPLAWADFSRLVIDPNRGEDDPTLLMRLYDGSVIPGNRAADATEKQRRLDAYYRPYHEAVAGLAAARDDTVIIAVHSFTRQLRGRPSRPWHVGILHAWDRRLADPLIAALEDEPDLTVGRNQPYPGHLPGDSIDRHALHHGRINTLIEVRNDLIETEQAQTHWGARLAPLIQAALTKVPD